jgi:two-component sensor histidine kinase
MKPARILWDDEPATLGMIEDITALKETEARLQQTLEQKDHLMRELNHRVKNNLYMIASLVNLKDASLGDAVDLSDIKHQIEAIGIVHDKLSYVENVSSINLRDYLLDIFERLFSNYSAQEVRIEEEIESITVPTKQAIPLGLISNEIATNAIKYGFLPTEEAVFTVSLITDPDTEECIYTLANSGRPFPDEVELEHADSLGLRLIQVLVSQLGGSIHLQKRPRTRFTLRLPLLRQD